MNISGGVEVSKPQELAQVESSSLIQEKATSQMKLNYSSQNDFEPNGQEVLKNGLTQNSSIGTQFNPYYQYTTPFYDPFIDATAPFNSKFPRSKDYSSTQAISETFPHLEKLNDPNFDIESISSDAHFYILRSSNDDNIHKAIKYQIWSSTPGGKNVLRKAWQEFKDAGKVPEIYLIFSVVGSNQFLGVAKMTSDIDDNESFKYWWETCKWFGTFQISWLSVKDIPYAKFEHIEEENSMTSVINLKDGTKINANSGKQMLQIFKDYVERPNIFDFFDYMDRREDYIRTQRDNNAEFESYFKECCEAYQENPESVFPQRRPYYGKRGGRKPLNHGPKRHVKYQKNYQPKNEESTHNSTAIAPKNFNLEEQFIVRTESDKQNKANKKSKKAKKLSDRVDNTFFEQGKQFGKYQEYQEEDEQANSQNLEGNNVAE